MNKKNILRVLLLICVSLMVGCSKPSPSESLPSDARKALMEIQKRSGIKFSKDLIPTHYVSWNNRRGYEVWMSLQVTKSQKDEFLTSFHVKPAPLPPSVLNAQFPFPESEPWRQIASWWDVKSLSDAEAGPSIADTSNITLYVIAGNTPKQEAIIYLYAFIVQ